MDEMLEVEIRDNFGTVVFEKRVNTLEDGKELLEHIAEYHTLNVYDRHGKLLYNATRTS